VKKHSLLTHWISAVSCCLSDRAFMQRAQSACVALMTVTALVACVYKLDIQQGNIVEREKVSQLKTGMTKKQVRFILGTPLVIDTFNQNRWDYYYSIKDYSVANSEGAFHQERLTLFFEKDQLVKIDNQLSVDVAQPVADPEQEKRAAPDAADANP
jgi:outer membrane protein assembly factor BamE